MGLASMRFFNCFGAGRNAFLPLSFLIAGAPIVKADPQWQSSVVAEEKAGSLAADPLYWTIEKATGDMQKVPGVAMLSAKAFGENWIFTLGPKGHHSASGSVVAEIGPIMITPATEHLLRVQAVTAPSGTRTPVHMHPGTEAFYVLSGQVTQRTQYGVATVAAGRSMPGHGAETIMEVSSSGSENLNALVLFVLDANKPFSTPSKF